MAKRFDIENWEALCHTIVEELKTAKFISASPTRAGRYVQVRVRMGKRTGRYSFYDPKPDNIHLSYLRGFLADLCSVYTTQHYSIMDHPIIKELLESEKLLGLYKQCHAAACEQVRNCDQQRDLSQRMKAKRALKSWILLAYDHGMKDKDLVELFDECRTEHLLRS